MIWEMEQEKKYSWKNSTLNFPSLELNPQYAKGGLPASQREERLRMKWWIYRAVKDEGGGGLKPIKTTAKKRGLLPMYSLYCRREKEFM
jgi:hypothetical protein